MFLAAIAAIHDPDNILFTLAIVFPVLIISLWLSASPLMLAAIVLIAALWSFLELAWTRRHHFKRFIRRILGG